MARDNIFRTIHTYYNRALNISSVLVLVFVTIAVFVSVASRYFFKVPLEWSEELARYSFIWLVFLGIAMAEKSGDHFRIEFFVLKMPVKLRIFVEIFLNLLIFITLYLLLVEGVKYYDQGKSGISTVMQMPLNFIYIALPISIILTGLNRIETFIRTLRDLFGTLRAETDKHPAGAPKA